MIIRLLVSVYVAIVITIQTLYLPIGVLLLAIFPIVKWVYWIITNKSISMVCYGDTVLFPFLTFIENTKINKKVKKILGW